MLGERRCERNWNLYDYVLLAHVRCGCVAQSYPMLGTALIDCIEANRSSHLFRHNTASVLSEIPFAQGKPFTS